jgi:hypothetical protein
MPFVEQVDHALILLHDGVGMTRNPQRGESQPEADLQILGAPGTHDIMLLGPGVKQPYAVNVFCER